METLKEKPIEQRYADACRDLERVYGEIMSISMWRDGCSDPRPLNKGDIKVFNNALLVLWDMKEAYSKDYDDRRILGMQIGYLASDMNRLMEKISGLVKNAPSRYEEAEELFVGPCEKYMRIFFEAQDSKEFAIKEFTVEGFGSMESKHGTREDQDFAGLVIVIGDAEALSQIPNEEPYWASNLGKIMDKLAQGDKSLIVATNYYYESNVLPDYSSDTMDIKGRNHIRCCLKDDVMKKVVERFLDYAASVGNHICDIPDEEILSRISLVPAKTIKQIPPVVDGSNQ